MYTHGKMRINHMYLTKRTFCLKTWQIFSDGLSNTVASLNWGISVVTQFIPALNIFARIESCVVEGIDTSKDTRAPLTRKPKIESITTLMKSYLRHAPSQITGEMNDQVCPQSIGDQENCYSQTLNYVLAFGLKIDIDIFMI